MRLDLNRNWSFTEHFTPDFITDILPDDAVKVDLPHTTKLTPFDYFDESIYQMDCGYRQELTVPYDWAGKRVFLCIGAAGHYSEVYLNGKKLAEHRCGYTAYKTELTEGLVPGGKAIITVRVDSRETLDQPPFGFVIDYMTFGGLYREVWLEVHEQSFINDVFVKPEASGRVSAQTELSGDCAGMTLRHSVLDGEKVLAEMTCSPGKEPEFIVYPVEKWSPSSPKLYTFRTELLAGERIVDTVDTRIGFRDVSFRPDGFYLNGEKLKLRGLNRHQSYPYIGYAAPAGLQRFDAEVLKKELGCNCVRTSHYPQSQHFVDRCDELGLMVFTEIPGWQHIGGAEWKHQAIRNVEDMVKQYRNHPSIILWGVRINESKDDDELYKFTNEAAHRLDPTRQTGGVRCNKKSSLLEDVYTYNDFVHDGCNKGCEKKKNVTPDVSKPYMITEYNGHMFPTKSYDCEEHRFEHALRHANVLDAVAAENDICGSFGWCMFDYNTHLDFGSGDRICYHGVLDMFRNKKPAAEVYYSQQEDEPMLEISSLMDIGEHPAANRGAVYAFTNADSVKLYKNGSYINEFFPKDSPYRHLPHPPIDIDDFICDRIIENENFKPKQAEYVKELINYSSRYGFSHLKPKHYLHAAWLMLRYRMSFSNAYELYGKYNNNWGDAATAYRFDAIKNGKVIRSVEKSPMKSLQLTAEASSTELTDGATYDAALVRIAMRDQNGNVMPFYNGAVSFLTEGAISIIGPETTALRGGVGGTIVRTQGKSGKAALVIKSESGETARIEFTVKASE